MSRVVARIASRLSLRPPQRRSLEILDRLVELVQPSSASDSAAALEAIRGEFPSVEDFEREFPSVCFALATGVGKTRLMGAFIAYLNRVLKSRHFLVLAPNLTIYDKLIKDFTPNTPKYVFQGIGEFALDKPEIITGDNYETGRAIRDEELYAKQLTGGYDYIHVNIFNISKMSAEVRGGRAPRIKRLSECLGQSYFEYLAGLDDLVLIMDESHRYRADAGVRVINELKPILGLELTATPQVERGNKTVPFRNVIYSYGLGEAIQDGFVKEPAVSTRADFNAKSVTEEQLERIKLEDGVLLHEYARAELDTYAEQSGMPKVKPFMLVVAQDTTHAAQLEAAIKEDAFFEGRYRDKVITVDSSKKGEERDENIQRLLAIEDPDEPTEIVIHVNMLKEGWDVTNLYTIVPLRAASSRTLVEQSIGRGLRLPYGRRAGVKAVDRLTIVAHDRFQEIVDDANRPDSIIKQGVVIGKDIPAKPVKSVTVPTVLERALEQGSAGAAPAPLFVDARSRRVATATLQVIREYERLPRSAELSRPDVLAEIEQKVQQRLAPTQPNLALDAPAVNVASVVARTIERYVELSIDIPRITVTPVSERAPGYSDFELDVSRLPRYDPVAQEILVRHLATNAEERLHAADEGPAESRLEDYIVRRLLDYDDVCYDDHADLLYKLAGQLVAHVKGYIVEEADLLNVLQFRQRDLAAVIHGQLQDHYDDGAASYEATVPRGFKTLTETTFAVSSTQPIHDHRDTLDAGHDIRGMLFGGFRACVYEAQRFDSLPELRFARIIDADRKVLKWLRPKRVDLQIYSREGTAYNPDFVVETETEKLLCEPKLAANMEDPDVLEKARAAITWCAHATKHELAHGGKPWRYVLIPHDAIVENASLPILVQRYAR